MGRTNLCMRSPIHSVCGTGSSCGDTCTGSSCGAHVSPQEEPVHTLWRTSHAQISSPHRLVLMSGQMGNHTDLSPDFEDEAGLNYFELGNPSCDGCFDSVAAHKEYHV